MLPHLVIEFWLLTFELLKFGMDNNRAKTRPFATDKANKPAYLTNAALHSDAKTIIHYLTNFMLVIDGDDSIVGSNVINNNVINSNIVVTSSSEQLRRYLFVNRDSLRLFTPAELKQFMLEVLKVPFPYIKNDNKVHVLASHDPLAFAEFFGGLLVLLGLFTRAAAFAILADLSVAIAKVHLHNGLMGEHGYEFPLALAALAFALIFFGGGAIALCTTFALLAAGKLSKLKVSDFSLWTAQLLLMYGFKSSTRYVSL